MIEGSLTDLDSKSTTKGNEKYRRWGVTTASFTRASFTNKKALFTIIDFENMMSEVPCWPHSNRDVAIMNRHNLPTRSMPSPALGLDSDFPDQFERLLQNLEKNPSNRHLHTTSMCICSSNASITPTQSDSRLISRPTRRVYQLHGNTRCPR